MDTVFPRKIDWRAIEGIQKDLQHMVKCKEDPNGPFGAEGPMYFNVGRVLELKVRVVDPELAQVVLTRSFASSDDLSRIPGLAVDAVVFNPSEHQVNLTADALEALSTKLRQHPELLEKLLDPNWIP